MGCEMRAAIPIIAVILLILSTVVQAAEKVGEVGYMSGTMVAQRPDGTLQVLVRNSAVYVGDLLITAKRSYAQVKMNDGSKMTLRPNSNLRIESFNFKKAEPKKDNIVMRLLKGGFRTVTGLIGKRGDKNAYKVRAASATIGIRGTDFTARLCLFRECKGDDEIKRNIAVKPPVDSPKVIGMVVRVKGEFFARGRDDKQRKMILGGRVFEGDVLNTGKRSHAVVAFRDEGRITLQKNTVFHVEKFQYNKVKSKENAILRLLKGGVRVMTGLIGRKQKNNYQFRVASATIGIRGTGFDAWCNGLCADGTGNPGATQSNPLDGAGVYVWAGDVMLVTPGGSSPVAIQQAAIIARDTGKPMKVMAIPPMITDNNSPRPDSISVDMDKLFGTESNTGGEGLYVTVHDGEAILAKDGETLNLGAGETGFSTDEILTRLATKPDFIDDPQLDPGGEGIKGDRGGMMDDGCTI